MVRAGGGADLARLYRPLVRTGLFQSKMKGLWRILSKKVQKDHSGCSAKNTP